MIPKKCILAKFVLLHGYDREKELPVDEGLDHHIADSLPMNLLTCSIFWK